MYDVEMAPSCSNMLLFHRIPESGKTPHGGPLFFRDERCTLDGSSWNRAFRLNQVAPGRWAMPKAVRIP
jgi:hypothetical protein